MCFRFLGIGLFIVIAGCTGDDDSSDVAAQAQQHRTHKISADEALPIGQLQTPEYWIVVHSAPDGLVYTVKTHDGVVVDDQLTEQRFVALYPDLYETLRNAIARPQVPRGTPELSADKSD